MIKVPEFSARNLGIFCLMSAMLLLLIAGIATGLHMLLTPQGCPAPAHNPDGSYSSYHTAGTMLSGQTIRMDDGDLWSCHNGTITIH